MRMVQTREKGREATDLSTGSYISLVLLGRVRTGHATEVEGVDSVKGGRRASIPSASWAENIIMTVNVSKKWLSPVYVLSSLWSKLYYPYVRRTLCSAHYGLLAINTNQPKRK
jgi:hypothetical protein